MSLDQLQNDFAKAIFTDTTKANDKIEVAGQWVKAHGDLSAEQRVGIYRNSTRGILGQHLAMLYPVCRQLIGEQRFALLCDVFIDQQPPSTLYLANYGDTFLETLRHYPALNDLNWIVDIARLEWARHAAWHTVNQTVSDFSHLANMDEKQQESLCFSLPKSAFLIHCLVDADKLWQVHQLKDAKQISSQLLKIKLKKTTYLIIWRHGRSLQQARLTEQQWLFLQKVEQRHKLDVLSDEFGADIPTLLAESVQRGWICSFN